MKIKIYPMTGDCYYVVLPSNNPETLEDYCWTEESINEWINANLKYVEFWREAK
jgi:hypothetical protein